MKDLQFTLVLEDHAADAEALDELTRRFARDLVDWGVETAERPAGGPAPEGAKGIDYATLNQIAIAVAPGLFSGLVEFLKDWKAGGKTRSVRIKTPAGLELEFVTDKPYSDEDLVALVEKLRAVDNPD